MPRAQSDHNAGRNADSMEEHSSFPPALGNKVIHPFGDLPAA
jgi:hypothetical protein